MKHFLVDIHYLIPVEQLTEVLIEHRAFLQTGYDMGILLMSGPKEPRTGGFVIARSDSQVDLESFFKNDPYAIKKVATHSFIEFNPVKFQPWIENWVIGKDVILPGGN
jgi:uncharacterized protein YciI